MKSLIIFVLVAFSYLIIFEGSFALGQSLTTYAASVKEYQSAQGDLQEAEEMVQTAQGLEATILPTGGIITGLLVGDQISQAEAYTKTLEDQVKITQTLLLESILVVILGLGLLIPTAISIERKSK